MQSISKRYIRLFNLAVFFQASPPKSLSGTGSSFLRWRRRTRSRRTRRRTTTWRRRRPTTSLTRFYQFFYLSNVTAQLCFCCYALSTFLLNDLCYKHHYGLTSTSSLDDLDVDSVRHPAWSYAHCPQTSLPLFPTRSPYQLVLFLASLDCSMSTKVLGALPINPT